MTQDKKMPSKQAMEIAESLHDWMCEQKYGSENILHSSVICDFVGNYRFKVAMARVIDKSLGGPQECGGSK